MAAIRLELERCEECGHGGYDHRRVGLLVDGHLVAERSVCRKCAVSLIDSATQLVSNGVDHPFRD